MTRVSIILASIKCPVTGSTARGGRPPKVRTVRTQAALAIGATMVCLTSCSTTTSSKPAPACIPGGSALANGLELAGRTSVSCNVPVDSISLAVHAYDRAGTAQGTGKTTPTSDTTRRCSSTATCALLWSVPVSCAAGPFSVALDFSVQVGDSTYYRNGRYSIANGLAIPCSAVQAPPPTAAP
jgi:hypothetical protein